MSIFIFMGFVPSLNGKTVGLLLILYKHDIVIESIGTTI